MPFELEKPPPFHDNFCEVRQPVASARDDGSISISALNDYCGFVLAEWRQNATAQLRPSNFVAIKVGSVSTRERRKVRPTLMMNALFGATFL